MSKLGDTARGVTRRLPIFSLVNFTDRAMSGEFKEVSSGKVIRKFAGHLAYAGVGLAAAVGYPIAGCMTGEWNPVKLPAAMRETDARISKAIRDYHQLENFIFGPEGIADFNGDGTISPAEKARAYEEMGIGGTFVKEGSPSYEQLSGLSDKYLEKGK